MPFYMPIVLDTDLSQTANWQISQIGGTVRRLKSLNRFDVLVEWKVEREIKVVL